jgi:hypothetical protein
VRPDTIFHESYRMTQWMIHINLVKHHSTCLCGQERLKETGHLVRFCSFLQSKCLPNYIFKNHHGRLSSVVLLRLRNLSIFSQQCFKKNARFKGKKGFSSSPRDEQAIPVKLQKASTFIAPITQLTEHNTCPGRRKDTCAC